MDDRCVSVSRSQQSQQALYIYIKCCSALAGLHHPFCRCCFFPLSVSYIKISTDPLRQLHVFVISLWTSNICSWKRLTGLKEPYSGM